ncbi:MAG: hypothetical protein JKY65_27540 [Planctomycetes bacterium]|nr:hypothetical protein [Planctomycetota bacterium]
MGAPLLALVLGALVEPSGLDKDLPSFLGYVGPASVLFMGAFVAAHLVLVLARSHLNASVFRRHPYRFTVVPIALFLAIALSKPLLVAVAVLSIWWDVYHSSLQTFGLGRIYDQRRGNDVEVGRRWDFALNLLLYTGPILGGASLLPHLQNSVKLTAVVTHFFDHVPARASEHEQLLAWIFGALGVVFLAAYFGAYVRYARAGYRVSWQKVTLLVTTGLCSLFAWGFNAFGEAFLIMNFFHALQYFGIVWWAEGENLRQRLRLPSTRLGKAIALSTLVWVCALYGLLTKTVGESIHLVTCLALVISIMHFWYDGFVWSVRKNMV